MSSPATFPPSHSDPFGMPSSTKSDRIQFIDIMRGVAVVVMVVGHSIDSVLSDASRVGEMFRLYDAVRGFTAPMFLFVAGLAFIVATEKKWDAYRQFGQPLFQRLLRILQLLAIGYALHFPFFSLNKILYQATPTDYSQLFQVDVLHCVAVSLLIVQGVVFCVKTPRKFSMVVGGIAAILVFASPIVWSIDFAPGFSPFLSPYFNQTQVSIFPLFPYAAFLLIGALAGHIFINARRVGEERAFFRKLLFIGLSMGVCGLAFDLLPVSLYPPHDYWKSSPNFFLVRLAIVFVLTSFFYSLKNIPELVATNIITLGQSSLLVYLLHMVVVYGSAANSGLAQIIGRTFSYPLAFCTAIAVLAGMLGVVSLSNAMREKYAGNTRYVRAAVVGLIVLIFLIKPH